MEVKKGQEKDNGTESIFKVILSENFPHLGREKDIQIHEVQRTPNMLNPIRAILRHTVTKLSTVKDNNNSSFKSSKRKDRNNIQRKSHETGNGFLNRDFSGQEKME